MVCWPISFPDGKVIRHGWIVPWATVNTVLVAATMSYILWAMDTRQFWKLIEDARTQVADAADSEAIAASAAVLLSAFRWGRSLTRNASCRVCTPPPTGILSGLPPL
jgi:hypothetical protein